MFRALGGAFAYPSPPPDPVEDVKSTMIDDGRSDGRHPIACVPRGSTEVATRVFSEVEAQQPNISRLNLV